MSTAAPSDPETRTIEVRLAHPHLYSVIELLLEYFSGLRHLLWRDLIIRRGSINELKRYFISHHRLTARQFNSLAKELSAKSQSIKECKAKLRRDLEQRVKATEATIVKLERKRKDAQSKMKAIASYRRRVKEAKVKLKKVSSKPKMPANIRGQFTAQLINECKRFAFLMHQKKRRLTILRHKLKNLDDQGVELVSINPAYTSLIGAYKYQGLKISSHEKAALAIARRAQRYSEGLKVFHGTLPTQAMMSERQEVQLQARHVWRFYSQHRTSIRSLLILTDKRPLLPYARALSLAKLHPSLQKSLLETREERLPEALRRASG